MKFELVKKVPIVEIDGSRCFLDTGYPYVVDLVDSRVQQFFGIPGLHGSFDGRPWTAPMRRVPCEFVGHPFEILCGDARDNKARLDCCAVPPEGVIGYDFFDNFTIVVDSIAGKMTFIKI